MRFKIGMPPDVKCEFERVDRLVLDYKKVHLIALFVGCIIVAPIIYLVWYTFFDNAKIFAIFDAGTGIFLGSMAAIIIIHEICHVLSHPKFGFSNDSWVGYDPKAFHFLAIVLMPFLVLTILPLPLSFFLPNWISELAWCSIFNAAAAGGDVYISLIAFKRIPAGNLIHGEFYGTRKALTA
jgi:Putative zincin peptidase